MNQLTVYKASAGSGKTFTLAREYMTLVIKDPNAYRSILAVTFTNKATEEMKIRILGKLYAIAHRQKEAKDYVEQIKASLGQDFSEEQIVRNAGIALSNLVHNYNYFRVETIDTFFQGVLRNLARELDLTANLRVWLNDDQVEQMAVDEMIEELGEKDKLLLWIMEYIKENIADDKSWNVIGQIKSFGRHIFKDYYKENADKLTECLEKKDFFKNFSDRMKKQQKEAKEFFDGIAKEFFDALEENGLSADDFQLKTRGIWSYFNKLRNGKYNDEDLLTGAMKDCLDKPDNWVKKSDAHIGNPAFDLVNAKLFKLLHDSENERPEQLYKYKSSDLTVRHLNQLRLLSSIDQKVREMNKEANRFLLSDTQTLLHSLIQDADSPFIFEKIGTQLDHVMIDEFQDTSTVQWKNFKVLLQETMSRQDAGNLIVGDVKQSIYRWRSGDWRLLNNIEWEFPKYGEIHPLPLDTNYRSDRNIIDFNNAFFRTAANEEYNKLKDGTEKGAVPSPQMVEAEQLKKAYSDVEQKVPGGKASKGYVRVHLLGQDSYSSRKADEGESYQDKMLAMTLDTIKELVEEKHVPCSKIAILVRSNRIIQMTADYLMNHCEYPLVSDEAFRLDASQAVNLIVKALYHLTHPDDKIAVQAIKDFGKEYKLGDKVVQAFFDSRQDLLQEPLYDLVEKLYYQFQLGKIDKLKQQSAYVCAFFDQLSNFLTDNAGDIDSFLAEWESNICSKSIHSDKRDGIQLISIHKSKGLEFDNVIMPFCDWKLEQVDTIWCSPKSEPYNELPLVPVDFNAKKMVGSVYEADYQHEHLQNMVDNLNLLYVAFTRAGRNLFVYGKRGADNLRSTIIEESLGNVCQRLGELNAEKEDVDCIQNLVYVDGTPNDNETEGKSKKRATGKSADKKAKDKKTEDVFFEYGSIDAGDEAKPKERVADKEVGNVFEMKSRSISVDIETRPDLQQFVPSQKSLDFINGDDEVDEQQQYYIKLGTVLHALFSTIRTQDDVEKALKQLELDGVLYDENVSRDRIENMLRKRLNSAEVNDWFSDKWKIMNECNLLYYTEDGKVAKERPDRVLVGKDEIIVIDFKFGKAKPEYHNQVRGYMKAFKAMGHEHVKGYLWYVYPNKVEEVSM